MEIQKCHCVRCGHDWWPSNPEKKPRFCAGCKSSFWWRAARTPKPKPEKKGRIIKYDISDLVVGGTKLFLWINLPSGFPDARANGSRNQCFKHYAKKNGWQIEIIPQPKGVLIRRIK